MEANKPRVTIEVDAATSGTVGCWVATLKDERTGTLKRMSGPVSDKSTYTAEVAVGMVKALCALKRPCSVRIFTSCRHTVDSANGWVYGWVKREWKTTDGQSVVNQQQWETFLKLKETHTIEVHHEPHGPAWIRKECREKTKARYVELKKLGAI